MINIKKFLGLTDYVSELDQFLAEYDHHHPELSDSQKKEIKKFNRIYRLRDNPNRQDEQSKLWENF